MADKAGTLTELRADAVVKGIDGASLMTRAELLVALEKMPAVEAAHAPERTGDKAPAKPREAQAPAPMTTPGPMTTPAPLAARAPDDEAGDPPVELGAAGAPEAPPPAPPVTAMHLKSAPPPETAMPEFLASERLGELPASYADGAVVLLARDPRTLFVYWDFTEEQLGQGAAGLAEPRAELHLVSHGHAVSHHDIDFRWRSFYLNGVEAGREYRAELYYVGADGTRRRLGRPSNPVPAPPQGPSTLVDDRFVRLPFDEALLAAAQAAMAGPGVQVVGTDLRAVPGVGPVHAPSEGGYAGGGLSGRPPGDRS